MDFGGFEISLLAGAQLDDVRIALPQRTQVLDEPPTRLQRVPPLVELLKSIAHDDEVDACRRALEMLHPEMNG
jgi:hypothetical protein